MNNREHAFEILHTAIETVKPEPLIARQLHLQGNHLHIHNHSYNLKVYKNIYVIGAGKASAFMAFALEKRLTDFITKGIVTTKYGHSAPCSKIKIREAGHPVLDENTLSAAEDILNLVDKADENDLVICLISGGGSALLEKLPEAISLKDLQTTFDHLLGCGASIEEMNTIRKHISMVKGGRLLQAIAPAQCVTLIISDVVGDGLETIASGPAAPDNTTFTDAIHVVEKYELRDKLPTSVLQHLLAGNRGETPETCKISNKVFSTVDNIILGNNLLALQTAKQQAEQLGYNTLILSSRIQGEAREAAKVIAGIAEEIATTGQPLKRPACLLFGGESTVTIRGNGKGGRNQEFVLAELMALKDFPVPYVFISCGTDGTDGPTDAAGAFVTPELQKAAVEAGLNPLEYLQNNDAYNFFERCDGLIKTGPTGTNVMDVGILLIP